MGVYAGLDVSLKRTEICVVDESGRMLWRGVADTHPEMIAETLSRWRDELARVGLETGSMTPWLARGLLAQGLPVVVMDARRAADALKARPVKTDRALAEMLQSGWFTEVFVKSEESHRRRALLTSREQLVRMKRQIFGQVRGVLRPSASGCRRGRARPGSTRRRALRCARMTCSMPASIRCSRRWARWRRSSPRWTSASGRWCAAPSPAGT